MAEEVSGELPESKDKAVTVAAAVRIRINILAQIP